MMIKEKFTPTGEFIKFKARAVANGAFQDSSKYEFGNSSPTCSITSVFSLMGIFAKEERKIATVDITGAYLNAEMDKDLYMVLNKKIASIYCDIDKNAKNVLNHDGKLYVKLNKALYGCKESALLWYNNITKLLQDHGFQINQYDHGVLNLIKENVQITVIVYVDDLIIASVNNNNIDYVIKLLKDQYKEITVNRGDIHNYLGMTMKINDKKVVISMDGYVNKLLEDCNIKENDSKDIVVSPATSNLFKISENSVLLNKAEHAAFYTIVGKLKYLCLRIRVDIAVACSFLSTRVSKPTREDHDKMMRVLRYLNGTRYRTITIAVDDIIEIKAFVDGSTGTNNEGRGQTGVFITLGIGPVYTRSSIQRLNSDSSTLSELMALHDSYSVISWLKSMLKHQGYKTGPAKIYQDNKSVLYLIDRGRSISTATKHYKTKYFFIKSKIQCGELILLHCPSEIMWADFFTKPLQAEYFKSMRGVICDGVYPEHDSED